MLCYQAAQLNRDLNPLRLPQDIDTPIMDISTVLTFAKVNSSQAGCIMPTNLTGCFVIGFVTMVASYETQSPIVNSKLFSFSFICMECLSILSISPIISFKAVQQTTQSTMHTAKSGISLRVG